MKRQRRQTIRRGNLTGRQRRRLRARVAHVLRGWGPGCWARGAEPGAIRDARRLAEAGLVVAVLSKKRLWGPQPTEVELFATRAEALKHGGPLMR